MASKFDQRGRKRRRELALAELAGRQHGVIALAQLRSLGLSPSGVRTRVAGGRLHRVHAGVYALGRLGLSKEGHWLAAVMACGPDALLSYQSAAALQGLRATAQTMIDVTVPRRSSRSRPGIRVHRSSCLIPAGSDLGRWDPVHVCCANPARSSRCVAAARPRASLRSGGGAARPGHACRSRAPCSEAGTPRCSAPARGSSRRARGRGHPPHRVGGTVPARFVAARSCPRPAVNAWMTVAGEEMQVDFLWRQASCDRGGRRLRAHTARGRPSSAIAGATSSSASAGWRVIRFTWDRGHERAHVCDRSDAQACVRRPLAHRWSKNDAHDVEIRPARRSGHRA